MPWPRAEAPGTDPVLPARIRAAAPGWAPASLARGTGLGWTWLAPCSPAPTGAPIRPTRDPTQPWNQTRVARLLGITHPIIQGPLGGLSSQRLTAAVSNAGGLGSFGAHGLEPSAISAVIAQLRTLTAQPFAINLWVSMEDPDAQASSEAAFQRSRASLAGQLAALGAPQPAYAPYTPLSFTAQVRALIDAKAPVFSFIYGIPPREILEECRRVGIVTLGTATTPEEAVALDQAGVDAIVASGFEAGGHRGSFLRSAEESLTGTMVLVPRICDLIERPVIAAGGIADARGIVAAFALGAEAVQIGTAFLACEESGASRLHRDTLLSGQAGWTGLTHGFTGRLARGVANPLLRSLNQPEVAILPYPLQRVLMRSVAIPAERAGRADLMQLWAGQGADLSRITDATALMRHLIDGVSAIAGPVLAWNADRRT